MSDGLVVPSSELNRDGAYDCGENENLFLSLAGMRDDTDEKQYFVLDRPFQIIRTETYYPKGEFIYIMHGTADYSFMHKATKEEIIKHFEHEKDNV